MTRPTGIVPPIPTPLARRDALDVDGLHRLVERVIVGGVHGIFALGSTGEGPSLSPRLRREMVERTCAAAAGRVPVFVGVTDPCFEESVELARFAAGKGAAAAVLAPPFYFPLRPPELATWLTRIVPELGMPALLYTIPPFARMPFDRETLVRAAGLPGVIGVKDSSGDPASIQAAIDIARSNRPDWVVFEGTEARLLRSLRAGARGGVPGGACLDPRLFADLWNAHEAGRADEADALQDRVDRLGPPIYRVGPSFLVALKCALSLLGVCSDLPAEPFTPLPAGDRETLRRLLQLREKK